MAALDLEGLRARRRAARERAEFRRSFAYGFGSPIAIVLAILYFGYRGVI